MLASREKILTMSFFWLSAIAVMMTACDDNGSSSDIKPLSNPAGKLYVLNQTDSTIYIYDTKTFTRIDSFPAQVGFPHYIRFSGDGLNYYILTLESDGRVAKYDATTNNFLGSAQSNTTLFPAAIAFNATDEFGYLCDFTSGINLSKMYKFNLTSLTLVDSLPSGAMSHDLKNTSDGRWIIACNRNTEDVTMVDTQTDDIFRVQIDPDSAYAPTGSPKYGPFGVEIGPNDSIAYIASIKADQIRALDIAQKKIVDSFSIPHIHSDFGPHGPTLMAVSPDNKVIYTTTQWSDRVVAISLETHQVLGTLFFETPRPFGITISDDGSRVYAACVNVQNQLGRVYSIDTKTFTKVDSVDVGRNSMGLIYRAL